MLGPPPLICPPNDYAPFETCEIEQSIAARFEKQVLKTPDRLAVQVSDQALSYADLNRQANCIAWAVLSRRGPKAEPVALLFNQGAQIVAAILGVLKAGKFYVPLDPAASTSGHQNILDDCGAGLVVGERQSLLKLAPRRDCEVLSIESIQVADADANPDNAIAPESLAYIYYTSGSTGTPKGVVDCHRNVLHNVMRYTNGLFISPSDRLTLLQPPNFSGAVSSTFSAILNGASIFPFDSSRHTATEMAEWLAANRITIYHSVPAIFRSFLGVGRDFPNVRVVRLEGDQSSKLDVKLFKQHFPPGCVLANGLGLTEAGLVRRLLIDHQSEIDAETLPVGYPVEDMAVRVVDEAGSAVGPGVGGEIAITSQYLAVGYWRRPDLTRDKFRVSPNYPGTRTYLTGDLGRLRADGCLEYLGRTDSRVKIRGNWVDQVEIEAALHHLGVFSEVVVRTWPGRQDNPRLVAYFTTETGRELTTSTLRQDLADVLPDHMIPVRFVQLRRLPLNANGKIDRKALPPPNSVRPNLGAPYVEPADVLQEELARIWESLLGVSPVGIRDNFFDLGGDSLLAMTLLLEIEKTCDRTFSPEVLLAGATVEALAKAILKELDIAGHETSRTLTNAVSAKPFFFLHGDYRSHGLYCARLARYLDRGTSLRIIAPRTPAANPLENTVESFAAEHIEEVRAIQPHGPYRLGGNCNGGAIAFEMARQLAEQGESVETLVMVRTSGRNARYWRWVRALGFLSDMFRLPLGVRALLATRLRWYLAALEQRRGFGKLVFTACKAGHYLRVLLGGGLRVPTRQEVRRPVAAGSAQEDIADTYMEMVDTYVPGPYGGRTILFWPEQDPESSGEALGHWQRICPDVELCVLPGNHVSCITRFAETFARELNTYLDD